MKPKILITVLMFAFWATGCYTQFEVQKPGNEDVTVEVVTQDSEPAQQTTGDTSEVAADGKNYEITIEKRYVIEDDYWSRPVVTFNLGYGYGYGYSYGYYVDNFCYDPFWSWYYYPYVYYPRWVWNPWYWYNPYPYYNAWYYPHNWNYNHHNYGYSGYKYRDREISSIRGRDGGRGSAVNGGGSGGRTPGITSGGDQVAKRAGVRNDGARSGSRSDGNDVKTERKRSAFDTWDRNDEPSIKLNTVRDDNKSSNGRSGVRNDDSGSGKEVTGTRSGNKNDGNVTSTRKKDVRTEDRSPRVTPRKGNRDEGSTERKGTRATKKDDNSSSQGRESKRPSGKDGNSGKSYKSPSRNDGNSGSSNRGYKAPSRNDGGSSGSYRSPSSSSGRSSGSSSPSRSSGSGSGSGSSRRSGSR